MARKRKANDDAPYRPPSSRKRVSKPSKAFQAAVESNPEIKSTAGKGKAKSTAETAVQKQRKGVGVAEDNSEDDGFRGGRTNLKKPLTTVEQHLLEQNKKSRDFIQRYQEQVAGDRGKVHDALARFKQELRHDQAGKQEELAGIYKDVKGAIKTSRVTKNPLFRKTRDVIRLGRAVLKRHQQAEKALRRPELALPQEAWKRDEERMKQLLQYGRQYGESLLESILSPDDEHATHAPAKASMTDTESLALSLFDEGKKAAAAGLWGRAAHARMEALASVVRTLHVPAPGGPNEGIPMRVDTTR
ncbi:hypothetical protein B0T22DRAFT_261160 [Podospora appendiculata]|uniref:Uncharacterized protein n=1 Tax=Podospora appendiculata TaxID=314037 RepID=A0AAE0X367_9PEZI|nr:hypothetical protein B0T22DRAFT_261160 [Podospora appendiculata]